MKALIACLVFTVTLVSAVAFANPPAGVGVGHGNKGIGSVTGGSVPPGLQNKSLPPGLNKKNKTPHGWSEGEKRGWHKKNHEWKKKHHNWHGVPGSQGKKD